MTTPTRPTAWKLAFVSSFFALIAACGGTADGRDNRFSFKCLSGGKRSRQGHTDVDAGRGRTDDQPAQYRRRMGRGQALARRPVGGRRSPPGYQCKLVTRWPSGGRSWAPSATWPAFLGEPTPARMATTRLMRRSRSSDLRCKHPWTSCYRACSQTDAGRLPF